MPFQLEPHDSHSPLLNPPSSSALTSPSRKERMLSWVMNAGPRCRKKALGVTVQLLRVPFVSTARCSCSIRKLSPSIASTLTMPITERSRCAERTYSDQGITRDAARMPYVNTIYVFLCEKTTGVRDTVQSLSAFFI